MRRWLHGAAALVLSMGAAHAADVAPAATALPAAPASTPVAAPPPAPVAWDDRAVVEGFRKAGVTDAEWAAIAVPLGGAPAAKGAPTKVDAPLPLTVAHNAQQPMVLASTTKLVTTLASLHTLPSAYRWRTRAWLLGSLSEGTLTGDLVLVGGGDATLTAKKLQDAFVRWRKQGLTTIRGRIVLDQTMFKLTEQDHSHTPTPEAANPHHARPDAFVLEDDLVDIKLSWDDATNALRVQYDPPMAGVEVVNQLKVSAGAKCAVKTDFEAIGDQPRLRLVGTWSPRCNGPIPVELVATRAVTTAMVAGAWQAAGGSIEPPPASPMVVHKVQLTGRVKGGAPYAGKPWATIDSPPLPELVRAINKDSNNLMARNLLLSIAPGFSPTTSTLSLAKQRVAAWLKKIGVGDKAISVDNGSGLSRTERSTPASMAAMLQKAWGDARVQRVFMQSLPIAGVDGTLSTRFKGSPAQGKAFLKTGTLTGVRALSGYVRGQSGRMWAAVIVVNSTKATAAVPAMDRWIEWVQKNG